MKTPKNLFLLLAMVSASMSAGCYSTQTLYRPNIKTVAVQIFARGENVYRRDLEIALTEAVIKRMQLDTPYRQSSKERADTLLTGSLDLISQRVLSFNPDTSVPRELEMTFSVSITWTDLRTGEQIVKKSNIRASGTYIPHAPIGEDFFQGSQDVIDRAAKFIVEKMEADW